MPAGLTLGSNGLITGLPTKGDLFTFDAIVADRRGATDSATFTLSINRPTVLASSGLVGSPLIAGQAISISLVGTDPDGDYLSRTLLGALPDGLALGPDGVISGVPTGTGASFQVLLANAGSLTSIQPLCASTPRRSSPCRRAWFCRSACRLTWCSRRRIRTDRLSTSS